MSGWKTFRSKAFKIWYLNLKEKDKRIVDSREDLAKIDGIFRNCKVLDKNYNLYEFKWKSGMRVYFSLLEDKNGNFMLLLLGGNKNSQPQDIVDAKKIIINVKKKIKEKNE